MHTAKRGLSILLASLLLFTLAPLSAYAVRLPLLRRWQNVADITMSLSFAQNKATCTLTIIGNPGTEEISATFYLQKENNNGTFSNLKTWTGLYTEGRILAFSDTYPVSLSETYRLKCEVVATKDDTTESLTVPLD